MPPKFRAVAQVKQLKLALSRPWPQLSGPMRHIHIGHHFYGAGNTGDDLMLAGFLEAMGQGATGCGAKTEATIKITCCTPFDRSVLARRFPSIEWLPYDRASRRTAIESCNLWLGLGGSPWQNAVSRWFIDHLEQERSWCAEARKPMRFLGVGGQDLAAYRLPETRALCEQAEGIWTRDKATHDALRTQVPGARVHLGADLAHIWLEKHPPAPAKAGRLVAVLNFDYDRWPGLRDALHSLTRLPADERIWLAQESRSLPGAEIALHAELPSSDRVAWKLRKAEQETVSQETDEWPCGEWQISSRFHATLVAAWAGSKTVVLATNEKLRGVADELGYRSLPVAGDMTQLAELLETSRAPERGKLAGMAATAKKACEACLG